ncbi:XAC2610-related protein [Pedobacter xixiisoli]|nr:hypothetical protein [Pedobacter xixiisoli]
MRLLLYFTLLLSTVTLVAQEKVFHQPNAKGDWRYIYPFVDKTYVVAIQHGIKEGEEDALKTTNIYFGKVGKTDKIFWKEELQMLLTQNSVSYEDFNDDGIKDVLIFERNGARGANAFFNLYLLNPTNHTVKKVVGFNRIVNPNYNKKHKVIVSYGLAGEDFYTSIYRIDNNNKPYQIGKTFKETDDTDVDQKIADILRRNKQ